MQVRPELAALGVSDPTRLDPYLEVERPDFDSDGVIAYLGTARRPTAASASATA